MTRFQSALDSRVLLFDGGFGSLLSEMGITSSCPDELSVTRPDDVRRIYEMYLAAGADVITSASFSSNDISLAKKKRGGRGREFTRAAVSLARSIAGDSFVALDIGPTGEFPYPVGALKFDDFYACFRAQAEVALDSGADIAIIETQTDLSECRIAGLACADAGLPFIASFTFEANGRTLTGCSPECARLAMSSIGAVAVGSNCSEGPSEMLKTLEKMRAFASVPILIQPNAGRPIVAPDGRITYPYPPDEFAAKMSEIVKGGAGIIGGCCGTTPGHISALKPLTKNAPPAKNTGSAAYICSARSYLPVSKAKNALEAVSDADDIYDLDSDRVPMIDIANIAPNELYAFVCDSQAASRMPLAFSAEKCSESALETALRAYAGVAAVIAPAEMDGVIVKYGAIRV